MSLVIRPFTPSDYAAMNDIYNAIFPDRPRTVAEWQHEDSTRDPQYISQRLIAEVDGQPIGYGLWAHMPWMFHPQKFMVSVDIDPIFHGHGYGKALYDRILAELQPHDPVLLRGVVNEAQERGVRFLIDRGFREEQRIAESRLDTTTFDWTPFADVEAGVLAQGIAIRTLADLEADPDRYRKLYDLITLVERDIPSPEPIQSMPFDQWMRGRISSPNLIPDAYFVALDGERYVGMSTLWNAQGNPHLWTGLTGTHPDYRGRKIALALKLRAIRYAQDHDRRYIWTDNASTNRPMLLINERLGFVQQPAWIWYATGSKEAA
jgi:GNAT superfamily N-acetyltransferase